jgi:putative DNA primase/helicase
MNAIIRENIPGELARLPQWVGWKYIPKAGSSKPTKVPLQASRRPASTDNPSTWTTFTNICEKVAAANGYFNGIGFVFSEADEYAGLDLDECLNADGTVRAWAKPLLARFGDTYAEISPSGRGIKVFCRAAVPRGRKIEFMDNGEKAGVEAYSTRRYFTLTTNRWSNAPLEITAHQSDVEFALEYAEALAKAHPIGGKPAAPQVAATGSITEGARHEALKKMGVKMKLAGMTGDEILPALLAFNRSRCSPPKPEQEVRDIVKWVAEHQIGGAVDLAWPEPAPLGCELPPVQAFSTALLPEVLREPVEDLAERTQTPTDYSAICSIVALAGAVNRRARIQPKRQDSTWVVTPNIWGAIVAPPGYLKSPILKAATSPLCAIETLWREQYAAELDEYGTEKEDAELRLAAWKEQAKASLKKGTAQPLRPDTSLRIPTQRRLIVGDSTFEKTHELLAENPAGLLILRDELVGWLAQLDRQGREGERAFSLECWNGDSGFTVDRIGRGSIHVPACCLSMLGGITPGRLRSYLTTALNDGPGNDGLMQRFQLLVWPDAPEKWTYVDRLPKANRISAMLERLTKLDAEAPVFYTFDDQAQELFIEWLGGLESRIRSNTLHPALISHLSKLRKTMPTLALLFALADDWDTPIKVGHAKQSIDFCGYLESHARRVYSCVVSPRMQAAAVLGERLRDRTVGADGSFARRDVYRHHWFGLDTPDAVGDALGILRDAGWVRPKASEPGMGRPSDLWLVNPGLYKSGPP